VTWWSLAAHLVPLVCYTPDLWVAGCPPDPLVPFGSVSAYQTIVGYTTDLVVGRLGGGGLPTRLGGAWPG
jgi:hypothetical protein